MDDLSLELRQAARRLRRSPVVAGLTVLTLGLGIGIVTAAFALIEAVLLRPLVPDPERVIRAWKEDVKRGGGRHPFA